MDSQSASVPIFALPVANIHSHFDNSSMEPTYTPLQGQYLAFIHYYTVLNGQPPAEADMRRFFRATPPSVHQMVVRLEQLGLIRRTPRQARSIALTIPPESLPQLMPREG